MSTTKTFDPKNTTESLPMVLHTDFVQLARLAGADGEEQWKRDRLRFTTATEAARLMVSRSPGARRDYIEGKRNPKSFPSNRAMQWGHEREDHIVQEAVKQTEIELEHNHQVCVKIDDTRFAATPDAIAENAVGECKTFNSTVTNFLPDLYLYQMQWQMFVCNKPQCVYAYEVHEDYSPIVDEETGSSVHVRIIERDDNIIDSMIDEVLLALEESNFVDETSQELDELIVKLAEVQARKKEIEAEETAIKNDIKRITGAGINEYAYGSEAGKITASFRKPTEKFDINSFRTEHPTVFKKYAAKFVSFSKQGAPTLLITPSKEVKAQIKKGMEVVKEVANDKKVATEIITTGTVKKEPKRSKPKVSF